MAATEFAKRVGDDTVPRDDRRDSDPKCPGLAQAHLLGAALRGNRSNKREPISRSRSWI